MTLTDLPVAPAKEPTYRWKQAAIWTDDKALLIKRYLAYFVYVTHHGSYIDGFAGQQKIESKWAAQLVLENEPRWLRHFFLCELNPESFKKLKKLCDDQPKVGKGKSKRTIEPIEGDFNVRVLEILKSSFLTEKEATFCLLDQRTFECDWKTVVSLAGHKKSGNKIELFYFLACAWFDRALSRKDAEKLNRWWGNEGWRDLKPLSSIERAQVICERFKQELGYKSAHPFAIFRKHNTGRVMYYMIHATDHPAAPKLMAQAYNGAISPEIPPEQIELFVKSIS